MKLQPKQTISPREKKEGTIQYGNRTWGTHARVFSQTLAHGNSKNEIRQRDRRRRLEERREYGKKQCGHEQKSRRPITS